MINVYTSPENYIEEVQKTGTIDEVLATQHLIVEIDTPNQGLTLGLVISSVQGTAIFNPDTRMTQFLPPVLGHVALISEAKRIFAYDHGHEIGEIFAKYGAKASDPTKVSELENLFNLEGPSENEG